MPTNPIKLLIITGPTAVGKSDLAVTLATQLNGEIISADSRQVYKGLNIGTGKITEAEMRGVKHHLIDVCDPQTRFTVTDWVQHAQAAIADISSRGKLPIICGGTGFYISALIDGTIDVMAPANEELRAQLSKKSAPELMEILEDLDKTRADDLRSEGRNGDDQNPRRIIRAIELVTANKVERQLALEEQAAETTQNRSIMPPLHSNYTPICVGITLPDTELKERIRTRLIKRLESGMIEEAQKLHAEGLSYERMDELGLEYRYLAQFLQKKITRDELIKILSAKIWQYARRQKTWWKKDARIKWFGPADVEAILKAERDFLL